MADKTTTASTSDAKPKKGKLKLLFGAILLIGTGAGGAFGAAQMGYLGAPAEANEPDQPQFVRKGEEDPYAPVTDGKDSAIEIVEGEGGSDYRTSYYSFEEAFTSNLADSPALIQVSLAASTRRDGRVLQWLARHELALRSTILIELAETSEEQATTAAGKEDLQKRLTASINGVLTEKEGFGGVDQVHFRGYLVQ